MQYAILGRTGLAVSRLGFGALTFTAGDQRLKSFYKVGPELADTLVGKALDAGVNFFDTADVYANGESEELLGRALKPHRARVILTTKVGNRGTSRELLHAGLSRRHIMWSVDQSLKRLGTDWIDFYVVHREDPHTPLEETLDALDAVVRAGKVRYLGFSNWSVWKAAAALEIQKAEGLAPFTHGQMYYSLLGRDVERDHVPMLAHYGLGLTIWSPLAYGFLSGAYSREDLAKPGNRFSEADFFQFDKDRAFALIALMRAMAATRGCTVAQLAIAWLLARQSVSSVLIGATKPHQLDDNLGAADLFLAPEEVAALDAATAIRPIFPTAQAIEPDHLTARALRTR